MLFIADPQQEQDYIPLHQLGHGTQYVDWILFD